MASLLSPGVITREIDLTTVTPAVASTEGGIAMHAQWGPAEKLVLVTDELDLVDVFGKPNNDNASDWFTAKNFLSYSGALYVSRALPDGAMNAVAGNDTINSILIKNLDHFESQVYASNGEWAAKYPGGLGDSLKISLADRSTYDAWAYKDLFSEKPDYDELHIVVVDEDGYISGEKGTVLEKYDFLSKFSDGKSEDGSSTYYEKVINDSSEYVWSLGAYALMTDWGKLADQVVEYGADGTVSNIIGDAGALMLSHDRDGDGDPANDLINSTHSFEQGNDGTPIQSDRVDALDLFVDDELVDISFLLAGAADVTVINKIFDIASSRQDCLGVISPEKDDVVNALTPMVNVKTFRETLNVGGLKDLKGSFMVMDDNWKYQFDKYNNLNRWVPCNGDTAGLMAETDIERAAWFSPGGRSLKNVIKLAWKSKKAERDVLYPLGINSVTTFPGEGAILYGDRTMLKRPSAFDRINVRRLFIVLRKTISRTARSFLFELNTEFTRERFKSTVIPFLEEVQGRQGITDFLVVCDETNNTGQVIDQNRFIGDIYIKPARSINFIELNFVAVRTDVEFSEVVGSV
tara:strand:+ start:924 stop:2654 length:1731 start_codon:yes stop_codon:yes gene_type:complete